MKYLKRLLIIAFQLACLLNISRGQKLDYTFENINKDHGLSNNTVKAILQDSYGFIWLGTKNGLCRYNSISFDCFYHVISNDESIADNYITTIYESKDSTLFIGTNNGKISMFNTNREIFDNRINLILEKNNIELKPISKIYKDDYSNLWVSTLGSGFLKINLNSEEITTYKKNNCTNCPSSNIVSDFFVDKSGIFWLATQGKYIDSFNPNLGIFIHILHSPNSPENRISFGKNLWYNGDNLIYIGTETEGLFLLDIVKKTIIQNYTTKNSEIPSNFVTDLIGYNKKIFIGTDGGGLCELNTDDNNFYVFKNDQFDPSSISKDAIWSLYASKDNILWIGLFEGGVDMVKPFKTQFKSFSRSNFGNQNLNNTSVLSIFKAEDHQLYIGTDGEGLKILSADGKSLSNYTHFKQSNGSEPKVVKSILQDTKGNIWLGTYASGIYYIGENVKNHKQIIKELQNESVWDILEDDTGNIWFGCLYNGVYRYNPNVNKIRKYTFSAQNKFSLSSSSVNVIYQDSKKNIWIGTETGGLNLYDTLNDIFTSVEIDPQNDFSLRSNDVRTIFEDNEGNIWVGTATGGLSKLLNFETNTFQHFNQENGFPTNTIADILTDSLNNLWISTDIGLCKFNLTDNSYKIYNSSDGLSGNIFNSQCSYSDNRYMYFGGINGVVYFDPYKLSGNEYEPKIYIKGLQILNDNIEPGKTYRGVQYLQRPIYLTDELTLSYKDNILRFEVICLDNISPSKNKFMYTLDGFDSKPSFSSSSQKYIHYTNLHGGTYYLRLRAINSDGVWGNETTLTIHVTPPFYTKAWFKILSFALIVLILISTIYLLNKIHIKRERILEAKVSERTTRIEEQKEELEHQHLQLTQAHQVLKIQKDELLMQKNMLVESHEEVNIQNEELAARSEILRDVNEEIMLQNKKIAEQAQHIQEKNNLLTKSLNYAKRIQNSLFPKVETIRKAIPNSFVFFRPKEIVSGDFYWMREVNDKIIIAEVDCTGHGVPGAFMSMIGNALLNEIVINRKITKPAEIFYKLNEELLRIFRTGDFDTEAQDDGMDLSLICIDKENQQIELASAMQNIFVFKDGDLNVYKGDIFSIGGLMSKFKDPQYTNFSLPLESGTRIFLCSDGFIDQFGGVERDKFGIDRFIQLLLSLSNKDMLEHEIILDQELHNWLGGFEQLDDILVVGMEF